MGAGETRAERFCHLCRAEGKPLPATLVASSAAAVITVTVITAVLSGSARTHGLANTANTPS